MDLTRALVPLTQGSCGSCFAFAVTTMSTHQACYSFVSGNANGQSYSGSRHYHTFAPVYIDSCYPSEIHAGARAHARRTRRRQCCAADVYLI